MRLSEIKLVARAMEQQWPIRPEYREALITSLMMIVAKEGASDRAKIAAAKALIAANAQNIEAERIKQIDEHEHRARLVEIAKHIPIGDVARIAAERGIVIDAEVRQDGISTSIDGKEKEDGA